jgi:hypothetical protein
LAIAAAWGAVSHAAAGASKVSEARLTAITSRVSARNASLVIEASEPVPYVATRPDALTLLLDFRNVGADPVAKLAKLEPNSPIAGVTVEAAESLGSPTSRVRISLARPLAHHVRSDRNTIVVDFDRAAEKGAPFVTPPVSRQLEQSGARIDVPAVDPIAALGLSAPAQSPLGSQAVAGKVTPAAAPQEGSAVMRAAAPTIKAYSGTPVSLDFQQADLRSVLRVFSEISSLNVVIDPTVQGTVDVALKDVPWDQALDIILRANQLGYLVDGTVVRIAPLKTLAEEETQRRKLSDEQALSGAVKVLTKTPSYAKAAELSALLTKSVLSQRGAVQVDPRTNTLIITDLPDRLDNAAALIQALDRAQPQVEIEARIVKTTKTYARALGIQWGFNGRVDPEVGNATNMAFPNNGSLQGRSIGSGARPGTAVNLPASAGKTPIASAVGLARAGIRQRFLQPRRGADRGRDQRQRPAPLDAARVDAEQRRSGNRPGRPDSVSDGVEQHRHHGLQGRGAHAEGGSANHRGRHGHHEDRGRQRVGWRNLQRRAVHQYPARHHDRARQRRPDDGHRRHLRQREPLEQRSHPGSRQRAAHQVALPPRLGQR